MTIQQVSRRKFLQDIALFAPAVSLLGCSGPKSAIFSDEPISTIKLAYNEGSGSQLNAEIAKIILSEEMDLDCESVLCPELQQWDLLAKGELHASLEVWSSRNEGKMEEYIKSGLVEDGDILGPIAKSGWYVPTYTATKNSKVTDIKKYTDPSIASILKGPQTNDKIQLLTGASTWNTRINEIIHELNLSNIIEPVYHEDIKDEHGQITKSAEDRLLDTIQAALDNRKNILFYLWFPHWLHGTRDLTNVELPSSTSDCADKDGVQTLGCDYKAERLRKVFWPGLSTANSRAYQFLKNFKMSATKQIELVALAKKTDFGIQGAARAWQKDNRKIWIPWIPVRPER